MEKLIRPLSLIVQMYCALMIGLAWVAVASSGFQALFVSYAVIASLCLLALVWMAWKKKHWLVVATAAACLLFCPSPMGMWPLAIGLGFVITFAIIIWNSAS